VGKNHLLFEQAKTDQKPWPLEQIGAHYMPGKLFLLALRVKHCVKNLQKMRTIGNLHLPKEVVTLRHFNKFWRPW